MLSRDREIVIADLKNLITQDGYIYALCMILFEDFNLYVEELHLVDARKRLSHKEASLILGFLIQNPINLSTPKSYDELLRLKKNTYVLLSELHSSLVSAFPKRLAENPPQPLKNQSATYREAMADFFGTGDMLLEPIFYSGTGIFDFQYLENLPRKYKYDKDWLLKNKNFDFDEVIKIANLMKDISQSKSQKVRLLGVTESIQDNIEKYKKLFPKLELELEKNQIRLKNILEFQQYSKLFELPEDTILKNEIPEESWSIFYKNLLDLFIINTDSFENITGAASFFANFSISPAKSTNKQFVEIGSFNLINSNPLIKLDDRSFFVPLMFNVLEAIYETPYYWLASDKSYTNQLSENRGNASEEMIFNLLVKVFGEENTHRGVKVFKSKGKPITDIDILCLLGNKALIVQVKSKKLTELSRKGDLESLQKDFQSAAQDAYNQGLASRNAILSKNVYYENNNGQRINISEEIDEVYITGVTTENYPALTHQAYILLKKELNDPDCIFFTVFDLELLCHYLNDPYNFLYYVRQRIALIDVFKAEEESVYLGYHLNRKLWKPNNTDLVTIDNTWGQLIERNYYPYKMGIETPLESNPLKTTWFSADFRRMIGALKLQKSNHIPDIIFALLDLSEDSGNNIADIIIKTKSRTTRDHHDHDFSTRVESGEDNLGFTYMSLETNDIKKLEQRLYVFCEYKKYSSKADAWLGFGSISSSNNFIDLIFYNKNKWCFDEELEKCCNIIKPHVSVAQQARMGPKLGRNDPCYCGSGLKYKKCCLD